METRILVVDDESAIADLVALYLKNEGYEVRTCGDGARALEEVRRCPPDLAVLDVMLPDMDGFSLCRNLREAGHLFPILMLTARVEDTDKITGLTLGADDYVTKPFSPLELVARVKTQLRRCRCYNNGETAPGGEPEEFDFRGLQIFRNSHKCLLYGEELSLTPLEFSILWYLCRRRGNVVSSEELFQQVWGEPSIDSNNTVMSHIARLREKMHEPRRKPKFIKTVWGWGIPLNKYMDSYDYTRRVSRKVLLQYVLSLFGSLGGIMFLAVLCMFLARTFPGWRKNFFLSGLLNICRVYFVPLFLFCVTVSWVSITVHFIRKPLKLLDELVEAVDILASQEDEAIMLSPELFSLEEHLNLAKSRALRDAYAAREADQRKNDLVVYLAHDLKTPLTSVIGYLTLLRDEQQLSPELRARYTGIALDKAERLEDLVNEFFDITRFSLTHLELEKRPTDLSRMLEQICSEFQPQLAERDLRCVLSLPPKLPYTGDPDKLARVFDNLLRNACHYSYSDTAVLISGRQEEHEIVLTFTNAGPTIPKEKLERIFDQFFRLDSSRASHTGGAGLGLAIAKEIIQLHGGVIHAWSENEKAVFTVRLPL